MFELNREFIINNNIGPLTSGKRFEYDANQAVLKVGKMINIEASKVHSIHRAPYYPEVSEVVVLPLTSAVANGFNGTLVITIGQEGRIISLVSDRLAHHTKDYILNGTPADWGAQFVRQAAMEDMDRLIDVTVANNELTIKAKDCYTRIESVVYDAAAGTGIEPSKVWRRVSEFQPAIVSTWAKTSFVPGTEGMGTVTRILKNMRLQTNAHLSAHGFDMDERPLPRGEYEQWTLQYVSERRHQSGEVFGSINHSLVTLSFFVEKEAVNEATTGWLAQVSALANDAKVNICNIAQPSTVGANLVDTDGDNVGDTDVIPGDQHTIPAATTPQVIEAKESVVTNVKKHNPKP
jgi:hypothetical protein